MPPKKHKITRNTAIFDNNIIFSDDVKMSLNTHQHGNNLNTLIIGGSGTGKTRYYLLPNLLNGNTSFCITDPKGEILRATGTFLKRAGYDVRVFNIIDMENSNNYNPFAYVYKDNRVDETKVERMIKTLITNACGDAAEGDNKFFYDLAENLITAFAYYLLEEGAKSEQNFARVFDLMLTVSASEMTTLEDISKRLGKETVDVEGKNRTKGRQSSTSEQNSILGVELKTPDQLAKLDNALSIVLVRGKNPFLSKKI